jgi:hypothetical protein
MTPAGERERIGESDKRSGRSGKRNLKSGKRKHSVISKFKVHGVYRVIEFIE